MGKSSLILILLFCVLSACAPAAPIPTATSTPLPLTNTSTPTSTLTPTATLTPTPTPIPSEEWDGEEGAWKITKLNQEANKVRIENSGGENILVFGVIGKTYREYQIAINNEQKLNNIRLFEENQYDWPVVVGDTQGGETYAYDPLNEVFLPMSEGYEGAYGVAVEAFEILEELGKLPSIESIV